jgi:hypothetical protein
MPRAALGAGADRQLVRRQSSRAVRSSSGLAQAAHLRPAASEPAARHRRGSLALVLPHSPPFELGFARRGRARRRRVRTTTDTARRPVGRTIPRTHGRSVRRDSHPPCSPRAQREGRPDYLLESWAVSMTGAGRLSPSPQPVTEFPAELSLFGDPLRSIVAAWAFQCLGPNRAGRLQNSRG